MNRIFTILMILSFTLLAPLSQIGTVAAQDDARDLREATFTAQEILSLASQRKFNAMYDRIHPDAHAVIPRAAAVGTFNELYGKYKVGDAAIGDAKILAWTWGVTGKTYDRTVQVAFTQPFTDEQGQTQRLSDVINLVKDDGGEWRWFFGESKQMVDDAIAKYGPPPGTPIVQGDLVKNVLVDLDSFYADVVSYTQFKYRSPDFQYVDTSNGGGIRTACGPATKGFWAFYCPGDATIYVEQSFMSEFPQEDFSAAFVLAHEFSHHVQTIVTFDRVQSEPTAWNQVWSIELELMADCMAGAWALDVDTRGLLEPNDIQETVDFTVKKLGDPSYVGTYDPQAHGTADERVQSILTGFEDGFLGCNIVM